MEDCIPDYEYGRFDGGCESETGVGRTIPGVYIKGVENITHPICLTICNELEICEGYDVYYARPEAERRVCQVLGVNITDATRKWIVDTYDIEAYFFFRLSQNVPQSPYQGDGTSNADCYIRDTPVYEGDCIQKWHGEFCMDTVCDVSGSYTLQSCTEHQETLAVDIGAISMAMNLDTSCGEVVGTLGLTGSISTFADDTYSFQSNIYHVEDLVYAQSVITSRVELTGVTLVGLVAEQNFNPSNIFSKVDNYEVITLSEQTSSTVYQTTVGFSFTLENVEGSGDGLTTVLAATFEAEYVSGLRRKLLIQGDQAPVGLDHTLIIFPGPCHNPSAPYNHLLTENCGYDLRISKCEGGKWVIIEDNIGEGCTESPNVHISEEIPAGYDKILTQKVTVNEDSADDENIWVTITTITIVAAVVGLCVYIYVDCFGRRSSQEKDSIVKFQNSINDLDFYETRKRDPATSGNSEFDDNMSEVSVSSTQIEEDTMNLVFGHIFGPTEEKI